jgi:two-component sensor histidine kinase
MHRARLARRSSNRHSPVVAPKIETKRESHTLRFQCPNSGREVDSRISAHSGARLISIRIQCPICESLHEWQVANESLGTASNGARLAGAQNKPHDFQYPSPEIIELREQLLDEFNHRLKNNLQILYGFLQIARSKTDNPKALEVLSDTSRRIGAMGTAQQILYSVRSSTDVSAKNLLADVCANARAFFSEEVSINYEAAAGSLPKGTAVPVALVLNELLTNASKHGADDGGRVAINVGLSQRSGEIELYVQDCGPGFNLEAKGQASGLGLVAVLAERLNGTFTVERRSGARCTLRFPDQ